MADLKAKRGNPFRIVGQIKITDDEGLPVDMTAWAFRCSAKQFTVVGGATPSQTLFAGTPTWLDHAQGLYRIEWTEVQTSRWLPGTLKTDIRLSNPIFGDINTEIVRIAVTEVVTK